MRRDLKILLVIDEASVGGGQNHVLWLAQRLAGDNYEVAVACEPRGYLVDELRSSGIRHLPVVIANRLSIASVFQMVRLIRSFNPEIVHTHGGTAGVYGRIAAHLLHRKIVHTYHGIHYVRFTGSWRSQVYLFLERFLVRWSQAIICVASSDLELALRYRLARKGSVYMIPNGINRQQFRPARKSGRIVRSSRRRTTVIGTIGRLHEQKGQIYLLKAAPQIVKEVPHVEFRLIGDGQLRTDLERETAKLGLQEAVKFLGPRTDVQSELRQMDLFVLPSLWEGMPFVLLEAMSAGVPIVATNVDGVSEMLENGKDALLVPPRDPEALARAILELVQQKQMSRKFVRNALKKISERFDVKDMVAQTERVYRSVSSHQQS